MTVQEVTTDPADGRILDVLRRDGRISIRDLADAADLPETTARDRLHRLERDGYVRGYSVHVDSKKLGFAVQAWVLFRFPERQHEMVAQRLAHEPVILSAYMRPDVSNGGAIRIAATSSQHLNTILDNLQEQMQMRVEEVFLVDAPSAVAPSRQLEDVEEAALDCMRGLG